MCSPLRLASAPLALFAAAHLAACGAAAPANNQFNETTNRAAAAVVEESDLYRVQGTTLYIQNPSAGLLVVDVADPRAPRLVGGAPVIGGAGGELYVQDDRQVIILLKSATKECLPLAGLAAGPTGASELALVDAGDAASPTIQARSCLPGELTASRLVGDTLYVVTRSEAQSLVVSIDVSDGANPRLISQLPLPGEAREIYLTAAELLVTAQEGATTTRPHTNIRYFSLAGDGTIQPRGAISVDGRAQGRFHMDLAGTLFRIVTFAGNSTSLHIVDFADPDRPIVRGSLPQIAPNETLHATRFDGDRAYIVTFRRTDPLWVIDLADPDHPTILGELVVPGWSDFIFPRGDRLIAVGRGNGGRGVQLSLFDVAQPKYPKSLDQIVVGSDDGSSEANLDFRGISIFDDMPGGPPLVALGYSALTLGVESQGRSYCKRSAHLQLVDVFDRDLTPRGAATTQGSVRRSFLVGGALYSLTDRQLAAFDIPARRAPSLIADLTLSQVATTEADFALACQNAWRTSGGAGIEAGCSTAGARDRWQVLVLAVVAFFGFAVAARGRRRPGASARIAAVLVALGAGALASAPTEARAQLAEPTAPSRRPHTISPYRPAPYTPRGADPALAPEAAPSPALVPPPPAPEPNRQRERVVRTFDGRLVAAGLVVFGAAHAASLAFPALLNRYELLLPVAGPWVHLGFYQARTTGCDLPPPDVVYYGCPTARGQTITYTLLVLDGLLQLGGLVLAIAGGARRREVRVRETLSPQGWWSSLRVAPSIAATGATLVASAHF